MTSQDHNTNLTTVGAPATTGGMHPTPYPTTAVAYNTHPPTDAVGNTLASTPCTFKAQLIDDVTVLTPDHSHNYSRPQQV